MVRKPRYRELADELRAEILAGRFAASTFPTEGQLCARFAVSRHTVREALRALQTEGLIARRRGSGTVIQSPSARGGTLHQPLSNVGEILQYARNSTSSFRPAGEGALPAAIAEQIGLVQGGRWFRFQGLRLVSGDALPIAFTDAYVHERMRDIVGQVAPNVDTIFGQLEALSGIRVAQVTQDIQAVSPPAAVAKALGMTRRDPALRIIRSFRDGDGGIIEVSVSYHPGDRFAYAMHIEVDG
ncbi:GntR family transcriptional regulator [Sphingomonas lacunae]|uniref:GntR family transcriptional regulator n=1 Tax=Sphingomonas lacunae TaxID=2698828 RepID=UPI001FE8055A|nr:GntR family transcriptional regulator [Sphingomonas lacunae]